MALTIDNPTMNDGVFERAARELNATESMTVGGTILKTGYLLALAGIAASLTWSMVGSSEPAVVMPWIWGGLIAGLVLGLVVSFAPKTAPWAAPLYAVAEGLFLGALSAFVNAQYPGIAITALGLTFGAAAAVLFLWRTGIVRAGGMVMKIVAISTAAIGIVYLASIVMRLLGVGGISFLHDATPLGIGVSVFICVIASLNLVNNFEFIDRRASMGSPKPMEWMAAFGVMVTLVWMYIEILRLLMKLQRRR